MSLPSVESEAQMSSTPGLWSLSAHSSATDFKLSLAPDIAAEIYKLIDLYERGKDRISELEHRYRIEVAKLEAQDSVAAKYEDTQSPVFSRTAQTIMIRMSFTFNSGIVELNQTLTEEDRRMPPMYLRGGPNRSVGHDIFTLPTISVWTDYAGLKTAIAESNDDSGNHAVLLFNAVSCHIRI